MACRISELVLKCHDPEVLARFWCEVLDFTELDREEEVLIEIGPREGFGGPQPTIFLIRTDEPKKRNATRSPTTTRKRSGCRRTIQRPLRRTKGSGARTAPSKIFW